MQEASEAINKFKNDSLPLRAMPVVTEVLAILHRFFIQAKLHGAMMPLPTLATILGTPSDSTYPIPVWRVLKPCSFLDSSQDSSRYSWADRLGIHAQLPGAKKVEKEEEEVEDLFAQLTDGDTIRLGDNVIKVGKFIAEGGHTKVSQYVDRPPSTLFLPFFPIVSGCGGILMADGRVCFLVVANGTIPRSQRSSGSTSSSRATP